MLNTPTDTPAAAPIHICLVTDAWYPQINGVVRTWTQVRDECRAMGHTFTVVHPEYPRNYEGMNSGNGGSGPKHDGATPMFKTIAAPRYDEIRLALFAKPKVRKILDGLAPDAIHIATEGPLGQAARKYCKKRGVAYTTSYHTQFPHYLKHYFGIPKGASYKFLRWFHGPARATLVPTPTIGRELEDKGFGNIVVWTRGVDTQLFKPEPKHDYGGLPRPIHVYAGRVAVEKNLEAFLKLDLPGSKVIIGNGPAKDTLAKKYPGAHFAGYQFGEELAAHYAGADVFVFPSLTDTFGVVMLEANACGLPVAAFPVTGPIDVVQEGVTGALDDDLAAACAKARELGRGPCVEYARSKSWRNCAQMVLDNLAVRAG